MDYMRQLIFIPYVTTPQLSTTNVLPLSLALLKPSCTVAACDLPTPLPYRGTNPTGIVDSVHVWYLTMRRLRFSCSRDKIPKVCQFDTKDVAKLTHLLHKKRTKR